MGEAKRNKQRECPAKGGTITPEDCGRGRNSAISCPADCPHNPFALANYLGACSELEDKVTGLLSRKLYSDLSPTQLRELANELERSDPFTANALHVWRIHGSGRLDKWKDQGFHRGWKNDEIVMLACMETVRPALIEFREVRDGISCTAVDLLCPESPPFLLIDAAMAARVCRFDVMLTWLYKVPAGQRLSGAGTPLPAIEDMDPQEVFEQLLGHLGAPATGRNLWLLEHMTLLLESFTAIKAARTEKRRHLSDPGGITPGHDLERYDPDLVPPAFLEGVTEAELAGGVRLKESADPDDLAARYRDFADVAIPLLGGRTPRQAAADPALRPSLVRVIKGHIRFCDTRRRTRGIDIDLNPLLAELALDELVFPPPPLGFVEDEDLLEERIPLDPPPPQEVLDGKELEDRIARVTGDEALWNRLDIRLADILDAFNDLPETLSDVELQALQSTVLAALGALHPDQPPGYEPNPDRMLARYEAWAAGGDPDEDIEGYLDRIFAESRQPALCSAAVELLLFLGKDGGKKLRKKKLETLFTAIAAAVWEAAHWPPVLK